jgi:outer membrane lipoprotein-sorting protein
MRNIGFTAGLKWVLLLSLPSLLGHPSLADQHVSAPTLSAEVIVSRLATANQRRAQMLRGYQGKRTYNLDYHGFLGSHKAQVQVEVAYSAPDKKEFKIVSQSGSKVLINRVLLKLLESEKEAAQQQNRKQMELNSKNYTFTSMGTETISGQDYYVLNVQPHEKTKFLYAGKIWVDANDFAVTRMEGEPAKNPSLWISRTRIEYMWSKIGGFWLPAHNKSVTQVRMGGSAVLTIDYTDYKITGLNRTAAARGSDRSVLPDPSSVTPDQH